jgi:hypothetical protein
MGELSDKQVQAWLRAKKPIAGKSDGGGLTFTLSASGTAAWVFRYRLHGRAKELTGPVKRSTNGIHWDLRRITGLSI